MPLLLNVANQINYCIQIKYKTKSLKSLAQSSKQFLSSVHSKCKVTYSSNCSETIKLYNFGNLLARISHFSLCF